MDIQSPVIGDAQGRVTLEEVQGRWGDELEQRLMSGLSCTGIVLEMSRYHLATGGKRLRALLPLWIAGNLGGCPERALELGVGLELLHNATLVHDDLQDGDVCRRSMPAVWHRWGAEQAINAGDALIVEGLSHIGHSPLGMDALRIVCSALLRTVEGQAMDIQLRLPADHPAALRPTLEVWHELTVKKTGALFGACFEIGGLCAGADDTVVRELGAHGTELGVLFQMQDDYLDIVGGKGRERHGSDIMEGKPSFPVIWAYENASPREASALRRIVEARREDKEWSAIDEAIALLRETGALSATAAALAASYAAAVAHPLAAVVPGLAERMLAPVGHALSTQ